MCYCQKINDGRLQNRPQQAEEIETVTKFRTLFGAGLLASFALLTVIASLRILAKAADDWSRGIAFGVLMAWLALAIHGTVDFNLQIPANALTLVAISAIGWSLSGVAKKHV